MIKDKEMKIVFMGTPEFAVESLRSLVEAGRNIVGVVTTADKKSGRGQKLKSSAVKQYAESKGLKVLEPTNLKSETFLEELRALKADIQIVVAFRMLPEVVWNMPPLGTINLHASLLPDYRGAAPINWAIINGEKETGLTTFFLKHKIDTGDILLQKKVKIDKDETAGSLHDKLMYKGGALLEESLTIIEKGGYKLKAQNVADDMVKQAPKIFSEDCQIDWHKNTEIVDAFIRGLSPYPAAWTQLQENNDKSLKRLKIFGVNVPEEAKKQNAAKIRIDNKRVFISTADGELEVLDIQLEGKKRMTAKDLLNGFPLMDYKIL